MSASREQSEGPNQRPDWAHQITAVAFDMDGLMVNTEELYTEVGEIVLGRRGKQFTTSLKNSIMGLPGKKAFAVMIERERLDDSVESLAAESDEVFAGLLPNRLAVMPGLLELLAELDRLAVPRCVATSSSHCFAREVLGGVDLLGRIDFVVTSEDVEQGKPAPDIYIEAAHRMQIKADNMMVLEDSHHGSRAGVKSGACTIAVPGSHSVGHDFSGVHYRAASLADPAIRTLLSR